MPLRKPTISILAAVLLFLCSAPAASAGPAPTTCNYTSNIHRVDVSASNGGSISRDRLGRIRVNGVWCDGIATTSNTDSIVVISGAGTQIVLLKLDNGGFKPGFTNEPGTSDEIEITVSLGGGSDSLSVYGSENSDKIVIGRSSGFAVLGRMNLNAAETTGIDADLTLLPGIEERVLLGWGGTDVISGAGGAGTGDSADFLLKLGGGAGGDELTGGAVHDSVIGGNGPDVLKGGGGPDFIDSNDGVSGNDQIFGGGGSDTCNFDSGDSVTSCP